MLSYQYGRNPDYVKYHNFRYIDFPGFNLHQDIYLYGSIIVIITAKNDEVWALEMESPLLAKSFCSIFDFMWHMGEPVNEEFVKSLGKNEFLEEEKTKK